MSLYEPVFSDGGDTIYVMDQLGDNGDDGSWLDEIIFRESVENLPEREKKILYLRFLKGKTQTEVAGEIGISQAQVSRLEKGAIEAIKGITEREHMPYEFFITAFCLKKDDKTSVWWYTSYYLIPPQGGHELKKR